MNFAGTGSNTDTESPSPSMHCSLAMLVSRLSTPGLPGSDFKSENDTDSLPPGSGVGDSGSSVTKSSSIAALLASLSRAKIPS